MFSLILINIPGLQCDAVGKGGQGSLGSGSTWKSWGFAGTDTGIPLIQN